MTCPECRERLQQWLDARTRVNATLSGGGATPPLPALCAACAGWAAAARRLDRGLFLLTPPAPSSSLTDRVIAHVVAQRRARRRRLLFLGGAVAAAAAMLLVAVWQAAGTHGSATTPQPQPQPQPLVRADEPAKLPPPAPTLRDSVAEAGTAVASLTSRTADETVAQTKALLPVVTDPTLGRLDLGAPPLDPAARSLRETGEGVTDGLGPVADSARRAVGLFFRELPPVEARPKAGL